jgi:hypothetical protein
MIVLVLEILMYDINKLQKIDSNLKNINERLKNLSFLTHVANFIDLDKAIS